MNISVNTIATIIVIISLGAFLTQVILRSRNNITKLVVKGEYNMKDACYEILDSITESIKNESFVGMTNKQIENEVAIKNRLKTSHHSAQNGDVLSKEVMFDFIRGKCNEYYNEDACDIILELDEINPYIKWEFIMNKFRRTYKENSLNELIKKYSWDRERVVHENEELQGYFIDDTDINQAYSEENIELTYQNKLDVLASLICSRIYGFGVMESIDSQAIDGWMIGTSGCKDENNYFSYLRSCWVHYKGKYIHFRFLKMESKQEMKRIVELGSRYNFPGALTEKKGYQINRKADGSRTLGARDPVVAKYSLIVRKHDLTDNLTFEKAVYNDRFKNCEFLALTVKFLAKSNLNMVFTGAQGSGKTFFMRLLMQFISPKVTLRTLETKPELFVSEKYPWRNTVEFTASSWVSETELQDASKKSDGKGFALGEVSTAALSSNYIKSCLVAYILAWCSHHALTAKGLINSFKNDLISVDGYESAAAERLVVDAIRINIHLNMEEKGDDIKRYTQRITEIVPKEIKTEYTKDINNLPSAQLAYYQKQVDSSAYIENDILLFNERTDTYEICNCFSEPLIKKMLSVMSVKDKKDFAEYLLKYFNKEVTFN